MANVAGVVTLAFWVTTLISDLTNVKIINSWVDSNNKMCFNAVIKIQIEEDGFEGWEIYIDSSKRFLSLTSSHADIKTSSDDGLSHVLKNQDWNSQLAANDEIEVPFLACASNDDGLPKVEAEFRRNKEICPKQTVRSHDPMNYIKVPSVIENQWNTGFEAYLNITSDATVNGWKIYLAFSKPLVIDVANAIAIPSQGHAFTLQNRNWNKKVIAGTPYLIKYVAYKMKPTDPMPCVDAIFTWKEQIFDPTTTSLTSSSSGNPSTTVSTSSTTTSRLKPPFTTSPRHTIPPTSLFSTMSRLSAQHLPTPSPTSSSLSTPSTTVSLSCAPFNYADVLHKSILFYEAQRSGKLPSNNRIPWRGDSALGDKGNNEEVLTGGWYDAGDFVKFGFPMAFSTTLLSWGLIEFTESYSSSGELQNMLDSIKWPLDYFIKAHVKSDEFYGQVGDGDIDHAYWGRPEEMTMERPAFKIDQDKPGSDLAAETAAAMAAGSIVFRQSNPDYSNLLLNHSRALYEFADAYRGKYSDSISNAAQFYRSSGYNDELVWGAAWLYKATKEKSYLEKAESYFTEYGIGNAGWAFSWDEKIAGVQMLLYDLTKKDVYRTAIENSLNAWLPGASIPYTPKGLAWRIKWGANRYAANTAFLALLASVKELRKEVYREFGKKQIHYMLGDSGRSFVVGFGNNPPRRPHHSSSSCPDKPAICNFDQLNSPDPNPQILYGALVGGPDQNDYYEDNRNDYIMNEVSCDYNAGFQSAVAALKSFTDGLCRVTPTLPGNIAASTSTSRFELLVNTLPQSIFPSASLFSTMSRLSVQRSPTFSSIGSLLSTPSTTVSLSCAPFNYADVLHKSILFYEAQRSGKLPSNNRIPWRGDSALGDKGNNEEVLTGGWYDAGDFVKFGFPMAFSTTLLSWGLIEFTESYSSSGELQNMLDSIKWPLDYFIKAHVKPDEFYGQVGDGDIDHAYWGRPEEMTMERPAFKIDQDKPGSDLAAETAAAMAAGSIVFRQSNPDYSNLLLNHSRALYEFADVYRGKYSDSISNAAQFYRSSGYNDELVWGAAWLYKATKEKSYLEKAESYFTEYGIGNAGWAFSWDEKIAGVQMLLYDLTKKDVYRTAIENSLNAWLPGASIPYTPKGLAWRIKWGANRYAANTAFLALLASVKELRKEVYREFGKKQIHYMLGDSGRSFVVGFGNNPPRRPHHSSSSCPDKPAICNFDQLNSPDPNPQILYGALVGGPDQNDYYEDNRNDYIMNEVSCDYNAGFQSAVAALKCITGFSCGPTPTSTTAIFTSKHSLVHHVTSSFSITPTTVSSFSSSLLPSITTSLLSRGMSTTMRSSYASSAVIPFTTQSPVMPHECGDVNVTSGYNSQELPVKVLQDWPQGFTGEINVTVSEHIRDGWEIILLLKNAISLLEVYDVTTSPSSGETFTLKNKDYNKELAQGSVTIIALTATKENDNDNIPCLRAVLLWAKEENCSPITPLEEYSSVDAELKIESRWNEGIAGKITVVVPVGVQNGWKIQVGVSVPITLTVFDATSTPTTGTMFTLTNMPYNKAPTAGTSLIINFTATKQEYGSSVLCASAIFLW